MFPYLYIVRCPWESKCCVPESQVLVDHSFQPYSSKLLSALKLSFPCGRAILPMNLHDIKGSDHSGYLMHILVQCNNFSLHLILLASQEKYQQDHYNILDLLSIERDISWMWFHQFESSQQKHGLKLHSTTSFGHKETCYKGKWLAFQLCTLSPSRNCHH